MPNYQDSKIYKLVGNGKVYIGSTTQQLCRRKTGHVTAYKRNYTCTSREIVTDPNHYIELIEYWPCNTNEELLKRERYYIEQIDCINKNIPGRSIQESVKAYYEANKDTIKEYQKQYREANKDKQKQYYEANKDKRKQYYEANRESKKEYQKQYDESNKDKRKQYYEANKDKQKQYYEANKDKILAQKKEYYQAKKAILEIDVDNIPESN